MLNLQTRGIKESKYVRGITLGLAIILLIVLLCGLIGTLPIDIAQAEIHEVSNMSTESGNTVITSSNTNPIEAGYYDEYTDREIPDIREEILSYNIDELIPRELFFTEGVHTYTGRYYGFVVVNKCTGIDTYVSNIMLIKIINNAELDNIYPKIKVRIEPVFTGTYEATSRSSGEEIVAFPHDGSVELALTNISVGVNLLNGAELNHYDSGYTTADDEGMYIFQSESDYKMTKLHNGTLGALSTLMRYAKGKINNKTDPTLFSGMAILGDILKNYEKRIVIQKNSIYEYGSYVQQLDTGLVKFCQVGYLPQDNIKPYADLCLTYDMFDSKKDFFEASFVTMSKSNKNVLTNVQTCIKFDVIEKDVETQVAQKNPRMLLGGDDNYINGAYSTYINQSTLDNVGKRVVENDKIINKEAKQYNLMFLGKEKIELKFKPEQTARYRINTATPTISNYLCRVMDGNKELPISAGGYLLEKNKEYNLIINNNVNSSIGTLKIDMMQDTGLGNIDLQEGVNEYIYISANNNIDLFNLASNNLANLDMYIFDYDNNFVNKASREGELYINAIFAKDTYYRIIINNKGERCQGNLTIKGAPTLGDSYYVESDKSITYKYMPTYQNEYRLSANGQGIVVANADMAYVAQNNGKYFMNSNAVYYLTANGYNAILDININCDYLQVLMDNNYNSMSYMNNIFKFVPTFTTSYSFDNKYYDIYQGNNRIASGVNNYYLNAGDSYYLIETGLYNNFAVKYNYTNIEYGQAISQTQLGYPQLYRFSNDNSVRITGDFTVYNEYMVKINPDHGYKLNAGTYYLIVADGVKSVVINKYIQNVNINVIIPNRHIGETDEIKDNGQIYNFVSNYGDSYNIPFGLERLGYDFDGWKLYNQDLRLTNNLGDSYGELVYDELTLEPTWTLTNLKIKVSLEDNSIAYWNGNNFVNQEPNERFNLIELMQSFVDMKETFYSIPKGVKVGHVLDTLTIDGDIDYFILTPIWTIEYYKLYYLFSDGSERIETVCYGQTYDFNSYTDSKKHNSFVGWENNGVLMSNNLIPDFTDNNRENDINNPLSIYLRPKFSKIDYSIDIIYTDGNIVNGYINEDTELQLSIYSREYVGYNVIWQLSINHDVKSYSINDTISLSALESFYGTSGFIIREVKELIRYNITYNCNGGGFRPGNTIDYHYTVLNAPNLSTIPIERYGYKFVQWIDTDGNTVLEFNQISPKDIILKAEWNGIYHELINGNDYTINDEIAIIDISKVGLDANMFIYIGVNTKEVSFSGNVNRVISNLSIIVSERSTPLHMRLKGMNIRGQDDRAAINAFDCDNLILEAVGDNYIQSGKITLFNDELQDMPRDSAALLCKNMEIIGDKLSVIGSSPSSEVYWDGKHAHSGIQGGDVSGPNVTYTLSINNKELIVQGGNGGVGESGRDGNVQNSIPQSAAPGKTGASGYAGDDGVDGHYGGNGGIGIIYVGNIKINLNSKVTVIGGNGGNGGNGGAGSQGGTGGQGGYGQFLNAAAKGGQGGKGGNGGDGGSGGIAGRAIYANSVIGDLETSKNGVSGNKGIGGKGGKGGDGGKGGQRWNSLNFADNGAEGASGQHGADGE